MPPKKNQKKRPRGQHEAPQLSKERQDAVRVAFRRADTESEVDTSPGSIDVQDTKSALESLGINIRRDEIFSFLSPAEHSLDLHLFSQIAAIKLEQKERSTAAFRLFDQDGKGVICFQDLQRVTLELGEDFTDEMLQEMVDEADRSSEGLITEKDFYRIISKINL